ncbi:MAG: RNA polymerase factor sigma-32 [Deltaproteobacteria bacterium]|nr:RNA polymerase factor sigma-32 [Deltaproteobacteria bacterium]
MEDESDIGREGELDGAEAIEDLDGLADPEGFDGSGRAYEVLDVPDGPEGGEFRPVRRVHGPGSASGVYGPGAARRVCRDGDGDGGEEESAGYGYFEGEGGQDSCDVESGPEEGDGGEPARDGGRRAFLPVPAPDPRSKTPAPWRGGGGVSETADALKAYLKEVGAIPLLGKDEERELAREYALTGSREAGQRLVSSNLRLVVKLAMQFQSSWLNNLQDLIQEGNVGLLHALRKFDPGRQVKFSYYAAYWIRAYMLKFIIDNSRLVKVGTTQNQRMLFFNLRKEQARLRREGFEPAPELLAERLNVSVNEVSEMDARLSSGREVSLSSPVGEDLHDTQVSMVTDSSQGADSILADAQIRRLVSDHMGRFKKTLNDRDRRILEKRLFADDPVTLQEMGEEFGVSRERVRQLEERLKKKIHAYLVKEVPELSLSD